MDEFTCSRRWGGGWVCHGEAQDTQKQNSTGIQAPRPQLVSRTHEAVQTHVYIAMADVS